MWAPAPGGTWVVDLDGVIWVGGRPVVGAGEAVGLLRENGVRVLFATNNSEPTRAELRARLAEVGIAVDDRDVLRSSDVAAGLLAPGSTAVVLAGAGVTEALSERGVQVRLGGPVDAVVVGLTRELSYERIARAAAAVRDGARFIATNDDPTYPTTGGLEPGGGAIVAAVATAAEASPEVAGKPHRPTAEAIAARVRSDELRVVVGDRPATDGALARQLGAPFALVLSGVTGPDDAPSDAHVVAADLRTLVKESVGV